MNLESENPLKNKLKSQLENSEWLQKFKSISDILKKFKTEIPLTQLCELKWITEDDSLIIHCPNEDVWQELSQQQEKIAKVDSRVKRSIVKYANSKELIIERKF